MSGIYDVLESWDLTKNDIDVGKYSKSNLRKISDEIEQCYMGTNLNHVLGRVHVGITDSIRYMETNVNISNLAIPLLCFQQVWLPDPIFSFFSLSSLDVWERMPDSGSKYFSNSPSISANWKNYWSTPKEDRLDYLKKNLPPILKRLQDIRGLIEGKAIYLYPWELLVKSNLKNMKEAVTSLRSHNIFKEISTRYTQDKYNLGPRLGSVGIKLQKDHPQTGLKAGTNLWIGDKTPILVTGLLNTMLTEVFGATFIASLQGDRVIHDFIRSGGFSEPSVVGVADSIKLPKFSNALWDDIIAIRRDSETLAILREIVKDASQVDEERALNSIRERLEDIIVKINEDKSLWNVVKGSSTELVISAMGGFISSAVTGTPVPLSAIGGVLGAGVPFLWQLYKGFGDKEYSQARQRVDLLTRIKDKIISN